MSIQSLVRDRSVVLPPRSQRERHVFASWLSKALKVTRVSVAEVARQTGVARDDIQAMVYDESNDTSKKDRVVVHEFLMRTLRQCSRKELPAKGLPTADGVRRVINEESQSVRFFSPTHDLKEAILTLLSSARTEIRIQAWVLSCDRIAAAVVSNPNRPRIEIILSDRGGALPRYAPLQDLAALANASIMYVPGRKNHNKSIVVDRRYALTGSVNFTAWSGRHDENLFITSEPAAVDEYLRDFESKLPVTRRFRVDERRSARSRDRDH